MCIKVGEINIKTKKKKHSAFLYVKMLVKKSSTPAKKGK